MSDRLTMDEGDILDKVTEWATVNSVSGFVGVYERLRHAHKYIAAYIVMVGCQWEQSR